MGLSLEKSVLSFAEKVFTVIGMNKIESRPFDAPLANGDAEILERCVIGIKWISIRRKYIDVLRREVQNLPKLPLV